MDNLKHELEISRFWIQKVIIPILVCVGVAGNTITVIVLTRRRMRCTTNIYLSALAIADIIYLLFVLLLSFQHYSNIHDRKYELYWRFFGLAHWLCDAASSTSVWFTVSFTVERYIAVCHPIRGKVLCTESRAKSIIVILCIFCLVTTASTTFEHQLTLQDKCIEDQPCHPKETQHHTIGNTHLNGTSSHIVTYHQGMIYSSPIHHDTNNQKFNNNNNNNNNNKNKDTKSPPCSLNKNFITVPTNCTQSHLIYVPVIVYNSSANGISNDNLIAHLQAVVNKSTPGIINTSGNSKRIFNLPTNSIRSLTRETKSNALSTTTTDGTPVPESIYLNETDEFGSGDNDSSSSSSETTDAPGNDQNQTCCEKKKTISTESTDLGKNETYKKTMYWFSSIVFVLLPLVLIAAFNCFLIAAVYESQSRRKKMTTSQESPKMSNENRITLMLIGVVILFLICQTPTASLLIHENFHSYITQKEKDLKLILGNIFNLLVAVNASCNFLLYCAFSQKYRATFKKIFCERKNKNKQDMLPLTTSARSRSQRFSAAANGVRRHISEYTHTPRNLETQSLTSVPRSKSLMVRLPGKSRSTDLIT